MNCNFRDLFSIDRYILYRHGNIFCMHYPELVSNFLISMKEQQIRMGEVQVYGIPLLSYIQVNFHTDFLQHFSSFLSFSSSNFKIFSEMYVIDLTTGVRFSHVNVQTKSFLCLHPSPSFRLINVYILLFVFFI